jgi:hypothetical protein
MPPSAAPAPTTAAAPLRAAGVALAAVLVAWPYIDLEVAVPLGRWHADAPLADLAACAFLPFAALALLRGKLPAGAAGYAGLLAAGLAGAALTPEHGAALHEWARKPLFYALAYGVGVAGFVGALREVEWVRRVLLAAVALCTAVSLTTSVGRILAGDTLWFQAIDGLTNNHKTLAVALAPALPLLWGWGGGRRDAATRWIVGAATVALAASVSRTAWISLAVAATFFVSFRGRRLSERRGLLPALVVVGVLAATYGPIVTGSLTQLDALRSRHSLDKRSWRLFVSEPLVGASPGASVRVEVPTFPDYRVNGVDAHGVVQKVGAEYGLLGLVGYGAFVWAMARRVRGRHTEGDGRWPAFLALHTNLLLSTETFSCTHWAILALVMGLTQRDDAAAGAPPA